MTIDSGVSVTIAKPDTLQASPKGNRVYILQMASGDHCMMKEALVELILGQCTQL
jgi:hypothetical protein